MRAEPADARAPATARRCLLVADSLDGGLGAAVRAQAAWLRSAGWEVILAAPAATVRDPGEVHVGIPATARDVRRMAAATARLRRVAAYFRPEVIHCHGLRSFGVARLAGLRAFLTVHGYGEVDGDPPGYRFARATGLRFAVRGAVRAFAATPDLGPGWMFLPHASPRLAALAAEPFPSGSVPTFLWLGRLEEPKRPDEFVRVVASVSRHRPVRGVVAGGGGMERSLRALTARLGAPVSFVGIEADIAGLIAESWAVVLFSGYEAVSFAVQEAMWSGRPVVASRLPALEWLVGDDRLLVRNRMEAERAMTVLCERRVAEEAGRRAARRIRARIRPGEPWPAIEEVYRSACAG